MGLDPGTVGLWSQCSKDLRDFMVLWDVPGDQDKGSWSLDFAAICHADTKPNSPQSTVYSEPCLFPRACLHARNNPADSKRHPLSAASIQSQVHCGQWRGDPSGGIHCVRVSRLEDQTPGVSTQPEWVAQLPRVISVSIFPTSLPVPAITPVTTTSQSLLASQDSCILWVDPGSFSGKKSPNKNVLRTEKGCSSASISLLFTRAWDDCPTWLSICLSPGAHLPQLSLPWLWLPFFFP